MDTSLSNAKRRKVIDIPEQTFRTLSVRAAASGTSLKTFIEKMLVDYADNADDSHLYAYLYEKRPEGKDMLNEEETKSFEDWLGLCKLNIRIATLYGNDKSNKKTIKI